MTTGKTAELSDGARVPRRHFMGGIAAIASLVGLGRLEGNSFVAVRNNTKPLYRISLAQWSLHRELSSGALDPLDFPSVAKNEFGIDAVEYVSSFYRDHSTDFEYLGELKDRADGLGVKSLLIMVDGEGALGNRDEARRRAAIENHFKWIVAAAYLGCHSIRVNAQGGGKPEEHMKHAADSLRRLGEFGDEYDVDVIVENHGGLSSNGEWLAKTLAMAGSPRVGSLPDFGNFKTGPDEWYDRYQGVRELMPFARAVSAKSHDFDPEGNETRTDYLRMMKIVLDAGYHGYVGIEYEGSGLQERDGIRATQRLLERVRTQLSEDNS